MFDCTIELMVQGEKAGIYDIGNLAQGVSALRSLASCVDIVIADDVIFAEIATCLDLDQCHGQLPGIFHTVDSAEGDVDGLVFGDQFVSIINGHFGGTFYDDPMLRAMMMALQAKRSARVHDDALDLETLADGQAFKPAPRAMITGQHGGLFDLFRFHRSARFFHVG